MARVIVTTKEQGITTALELIAKYPLLSTVEDIIDQARLDGTLTDETSTLIVWGRLHRFIPNLV
jgi:hypothetical protein